MNTAPGPGPLSDEADLRRPYAAPAQRSLDKEIGYLDGHCRAFIEHSPFAVLATSDGQGRVDVSPKGGPPGFIAVLDEHHLAVPDMAGNNRLDSLCNIVRSPGASLLFFIPGVGETLRVVGEAGATTDRSVLEACSAALPGIRANVAIVMAVSTAYIHCAKALRRSGLWDPPSWPSTDDMPTTACMLRDHIGMQASEVESKQWLETSYEATMWAVGGQAGA
ncbi:MAG TPA: MSMEG_1061 family FMN-dependent PPOX-type flavoprotein [Acidimicrobiales bacterium]|nr:MSMEG_1061 family FMN-dependent PPOX-type flavoprotein [Acidimicrobiales bacterium]